MNPKIAQKLSRRRHRRLLYAAICLGLYFVYALQWMFDVRGWIENGLVSIYFPIILFSVLIIAMCAVELIHFYIEDHEHDHDDPAHGGNQTDASSSGVDK